jgi:hypothetical protein
MKRILDRIEEFWCLQMHSGVMWPIRGHYICRDCHREYPVSFEAKRNAAQRPATSTYHPATNSLY